MTKALNTSASLISSMEELLRIREAAKAQGVHEQTIRNRDEAGKIRTVRGPGGQRRIHRSEIERMMDELERREVKLYALVSTFAQKNDLERQVQRLKQSCPDAGLFSDYRSGLKLDRKGFLALLEAVRQHRVSMVVVICEDRLARFGADIIRRLFASYGAELEVPDSVELATTGQELAKDLVAIIASFSARLHGLRSHKTKALLRETRKVLKDT